MFIGSLTRIINTRNHKKCICLDNKPCMSRPTLINLYPNEYSQGFHYFPFTVNLDRCVKSCNSPIDLSNRVCVLDETNNLNLHVFNMIIRIKESKTLTKHIWCKCQCNFHGRNCSLNQKWNNDRYCYKCKNPKEHRVCQNGKNVGSIIDNSLTTYDEIIDAKQQNVLQQNHSNEF